MRWWACGDQKLRAERSTWRVTPQSGGGGGRFFLSVFLDFFRGITISLLLTFHGIITYGILRYTDTGTPATATCTNQSQQ